MSYLAFSESQASFLQRVASANAPLWEYQVRVSILDAHISGTIPELREKLIESRDMLLRGTIELPPIQNLSQYVVRDPGGLMISRPGNDGKPEIEHLGYSGSDPMAWLLAAYGNATELLNVATRLIEVCDECMTSPRSEPPFKLDPPQLKTDPRVPIINECIDSFVGVTAEDVLRVFDLRTGTLPMKSQVKWKNAIIGEAIRIGLGLQPRQLAGVFIRDGKGDEQSWMTKNIQPQNRFGRHVSSARDKGIAEYDDIQPLALEITRKLRQLTSV